MSIDDRGVAPIGADAAKRQVMNCDDYELLDATSGDATASRITNCRCFETDADGIVKIDYTRSVDGTTMTEVKVVKGGVIQHIRNVTKLYRYYTGSTAITAQSYNTSGTLVNAIKVRR